MKKLALFSTAALILVTSQISLATVADNNPCNIEYEKIRENDAVLKSRHADLAKLCNFTDTANVSPDGKALLQRYGKTICAALMENEYDYPLQCNYKSLLDQKKLDVSEVMAIAGYTAEYYNYLSPDAIAVKPGSGEYKGYDVFNRVLLSAIAKLSKYPEFQFNDVSYRGTSLHGVQYKVSNEPLTITRWNSSSCAKEIAYGPQTIMKSDAEVAAIKKEEGEDAPGLQYMIYDRDPKSVPAKMNTCQKIYYSENQAPPLTPGSTFGDGDLKIIFLPPKKGVSRRVALYNLSSRRAEAEILVAPNTQYRVVKVVNPSDPGGDQINTEVTMQELDN